MADDILFFSFPYRKLGNPVYTTIRRHHKKTMNVGSIVNVVVKNHQEMNHAAIIIHHRKSIIRDIPDDFLIKDTEKENRTTSLSFLNRFYKVPVSENDAVHVYWLKKAGIDVSGQEQCWHGDGAAQLL